MAVMDMPEIGPLFALLTRVLGPTVVDRFIGAQLAGPPAPDAGQARFVAEVARSWDQTLDADAGGNDDPQRAVRLPKLASIGATSPRSRRRPSTGCATICAS